MAAALLLLVAFAAAAPYLTSAGQGLVAIIARHVDPPVRVPGDFAETTVPVLRSPVPRFTEYAPPDGVFAPHVTHYRGYDRIWYATGPAAAADIPPGDRPAAVVLLHGSNRDGRSMLDMWQELARQEAVTLIAPDALDPAGWNHGSDGMAFLEQVLAEAAKLHAFDPGRVYLFGHSAGAIHALSLANRGGGPWRAVAVHAGGLPESRIRAREGGVALRIYLGDRDHLFPLDKVRAEARALAKAGHDTELAVIPGHTHWFYAIGPRLALHAWGFFSRYPPR